MQIKNGKISQWSDYYDQLKSRRYAVRSGSPSGLTSDRSWSAKCTSSTRLWPREHPEPLVINTDEKAAYPRVRFDDHESETHREHRARRRKIMIITNGPKSPVSNVDLNAEDMRLLLTKQKEAWLANGIPNYATRIDRLDRLIMLLVDNKDEIAATESELQNFWEQWENSFQGSYADLIFRALAGLRRAM
jgi:hypothetical protein